MEYIVKVKTIHPVTHDVYCIRLEKPEGYHIIPGQAADVAINKPGLSDQQRPFTFTMLNDDPYLEFTIKSYSDHAGVTSQIPQLQPGDEIILGEPWGAIQYDGEGYFIAGGAGITPFIAILRQLHRESRIGGNKLFFSNKTQADIIYEEELREILGLNLVCVVTKEPHPAYRKEFIDEAFLKKEIADLAEKPFYICGPDAMVSALTEVLIRNGVSPNRVVFEK